MSLCNSTYCFNFTLSGEKASDGVHAEVGESRASERQPRKEYFHKGATERCSHYALRVEKV